MTLGQDGNLYGTTNNGGEANLGVVFKLDKSGHETVLHTFQRGAEGNQPDLAGVILDPDYNLYGTTSFSAAGGAGQSTGWIVPATRRSSMPFRASTAGSTSTTRVSSLVRTASSTVLPHMAGPRRRRLVPIGWKGL